MTEMKAWYQSKTVWGALIAVVAPLLHVVGLNLPAGFENDLAEGLMTVAGGVGGLIALYGRLAATRAIK
ncbi:hypothetical protein [Rhizobium skierniewicense]|uniref:hypothetical protein n=1 Tax=Rhizobium skierniewicense TaxID=984260 RepID=UPI001572F702|nr:hypothetical protein [Rhizobium skierniewicense]NTF31269.1 hypothetical protein [Rhizobium skierniewicense]